MAKQNFDLTNNSGSLPKDAKNNGTNENHDPVETGEEVFEAKANDTVVIADPSPVVILFGSGNSGKTMTLIRLTRYLIKQGYKVTPERTFRDARDPHYRKMCDNFTSLVNSNKAPGRNQVIDFMLVKVMDKSGRPICQLLEAPGEHYFDPKAPRRPFPTYIDIISQSNNSRTWLFIVEKDWENQEDRNNFAHKITELQQQYVLTSDKVIFTCHKADKHGQYISGGEYNESLFFKDIKNQYPNIFSRYENSNPISRFWRKYNFDFVVFSAGVFPDDGEGGKKYVPSKDHNPAKLWKAILKTVRG